MSLLHVSDFIVTLFILSILLMMWFWHFRNKARRIWRCYRYHGGGVLQTPRPMTLQEATVWLGESGCEVSHVDTEHSFIFYRPRGA